jgi:hypothetical protein
VHRIKSDDESGHINAKEDFTAAQVALGLGIGYKATEQLILYGRYNFGLTDVSRFDNIVDHSSWPIGNCNSIKTLI